MLCEVLSQKLLSGSGLPSRLSSLFPFLLFTYSSFIHKKWIQSLNTMISLFLKSTSHHQIGWWCTISHLSITWMAQTGELESLSPPFSKVRCLMIMRSALLTAVPPGEQITRTHSSCVIGTLFWTSCPFSFPFLWCLEFATVLSVPWVWLCQILHISETLQLYLPALAEFI